MRSINIGASSMETIFRQIQFDRPIITTEFTEQQTSFTLDARGHQGWHFNYPPGNIILAVPQVMHDSDVPHVVLTGTGKQVTYSWDGTAGKYVATVKQEDGQDVVLKGKVTINMLNMNQKWESGFIYCYAFLEDDLQPGDDKVKGPESISTVFDPSKWTDQW